MILYTAHNFGASIELVDKEDLALRCVSRLSSKYTLSVGSIMRTDDVHIVSLILTRPLLIHRSPSRREQIPVLANILLNLSAVSFDSVGAVDGIVIVLETLLNEQSLANLISICDKYEALR